jgi:hypothetical protein
MSKSRARFARQYIRRSPVFQCQVCERMTRDTGQGVDHLCEQCFEIAGLDNMVNDDGLKPGEPRFASARAECDELLAKAVKLGSNGDMIRKSNTYIWCLASDFEPAEPAPSADQQLAAYERKIARKDAIEWMDETIAVHERAIRDLKARREQFLATFDGTEQGMMTAVDHVGAFVNDIQNGVARNVRFDLAASIAAKVANVINK